MDLKQKHKEFNSLKNDIEKWKWVKNNQDCGIIIMLDNDDTFGIIPNQEGLLFQFDKYIGWDDGVFNLLEAMNIKCSGGLNLNI